MPWRVDNSLFGLRKTLVVSEWNCENIVISEKSVQAIVNWIPDEE